MKKHWKQTQESIKTVAATSWSAKEATLSTLVPAFLVSKAMYGYIFLRLTKKHKETLEVLIREAMRELTGLPRFTENGALIEHAQVNRLSDLADDHRQDQIERLQ